MRFTREWYIPKEAQEIRDPESDAVAYLANGIYGHTGKEKWHAVAFAGKRQKPDWNYTFSSEEQARRYIAEHAESRRKSIAAADERKAARSNIRAADHYKVGDLLYTSWGYDQTNIDFYKVVRVLDKSVEIVAIGAKDLTVDGGVGPLAGYCSPDPSIEIREGYGAQYNGIKRVQGGYNGEAYVRVMPHSGGYKTEVGRKHYHSWGH
jgi:hypothetical protein